MDILLQRYRRTQMNAVFDPLEESAPIARRLAPELCRNDPDTGRSCAPSHGLWQYLRLLGLALSPEHHRELFQRALDGVAAPAEPVRVLVSGAADYAMLAHVLAAFGRRGVKVAATVLDLCETPLALNRWYAERVAQPLETHCGDILEYSPRERFDVVCTHAFFAMIPARQRPALLGKWHALLRPGGIAVTVNRVRPDNSAAQVSFGEDEVLAFREAVRARARAFGPALGIDPDALALDAEHYARRQHFHPVRSAEEIGALFEQAGFALDHLSVAPIAQGKQAGIAGPTVPGTADYLRVIAKRR